MFIVKSKGPRSSELRGMQSRGRATRTLVEGVDVDLSFEVCREFGEVSVESVDVIFDGDEIIGVVEIVEAGFVFESVKIFGRNIKKHIVVVAGRDGVDERN